MVYCSVPFCKSSSKSGKTENLSFHDFPKDNEQKQKWLSAISREGEQSGSSWVPSQFSKVCGNHFTIDNFSISTKRKILLPNSVPTRFDNDPEHNKRITKRRKTPKERDFSEDTSSKKRKSDQTEEQTFGPDSTEVVEQTFGPDSTEIEEQTFGPDSTEVEEQTFGPDSAEVEVQTSRPTEEQTFRSYSTELEQTKDQETQCDIRHLIMRNDKKKNKQRMIKISKLKKANQRLREANKNLKVQLRGNLKKKISDDKGNKFVSQAKKMYAAAQNKNLQAAFLVEQVEAFGKKKVKYQESTLKISILLSRNSSKGYTLLKNLNILHIPNKSTLKRYVGYSKDETGITSLAKARLKAEITSLSHKNEKIGSLIIDEMSIKPQLMSQPC